MCQTKIYIAIQEESQVMIQRCALKDLIELMKIEEKIKQAQKKVLIKDLEEFSRKKHQRLIQKVLQN